VAPVPEIELAKKTVAEDIRISHRTNNFQGAVNIREPNEQIDIAADTTSRVFIERLGEANTLKGHSWDSSIA
jgi:hypothetical protein